MKLAQNLAQAQKATIPISVLVAKSLQGWYCRAVMVVYERKYIAYMRGNFFRSLHSVRYLDESGAKQAAGRQTF
jgi:hypothetical protein